MTSEWDITVLVPPLMRRRPRDIEHISLYPQYEPLV